MRTLLEITEAIKDGEKPTYEELYYSVIALQALHHFDSHYLIELAYDESGPFNNPEFKAEESFKRNKKAFATPPKDYVGWSNDPANPDYQARRRVFKKIVDAALGGELPQAIKGAYQKGKDKWAK